MNAAPGALCRQAIEGLIKEVLPLILKMMPMHLLDKFRMNIVGSNVVPEYLLKLFAKNKGYVVFHGQLPDNEVSSALISVICNSFVAQLTIRFLGRAVI